MRLTPNRFNGFIFQQANKVDSDFVTPYDWSIGGISTNSIQRTQNFPLFTAKGYGAAIKVVTVNFSNVDIDRNAFVVAMDVLGDEQHQLLANDELGRTWYVNAVCVGLNEESTSGTTATFGAIFEIDDPIWKLYTPSMQTILVNGTGSGTITPTGNQPALPVITITPTNAAGAAGFSYARYIQIINNSPNALTNYPLNLTGAGLDTAALVAAGKMLANGDDLRIYVDGVEVKRWFGGGGINSTTTKIWINWTQPANSNMTLGSAIAGTGDIATITLENTADNIAKIALIPISGNVLIGTELFVYTGVDIGALQLTGVTRAERGTSMAAHSAGDAVYFVTHDVWIYYGNSSISPYVVDDTTKPIIKLTSLNTSWIYEEFGNVSGLRTGAWSFFTADNLGEIYTAAQYTNSDPYAAMGLHISAKPAHLYWSLYQPCGVTTITATGQKYRSTSSWPTVTFEKSANGSSWVVQWTEATPSVTVTWEALDSHSGVALGATYYYLKSKMIATDVVNRSANHEFDDVTLTIDSSKVPTITILAEINNFTLDIVFVNAATGDEMHIILSMPLNVDLVVDTKNKTMTLYDGTNQINALTDMPIRSEWFQLLPQANLINITDAAQVTCAFEWEDRAM